MVWQIDTPTSAIEFDIRNMGFRTVHGTFTTFTGTFNIDESNLSNSEVSIQIEATSIKTDTAQRDKHLRTSDFLDVEKYPAMTFQSKRVELTDSQHGRVIGDLTIRNITREVVLEIEHTGIAADQHHVTFDAQTTINRLDWGVGKGGALSTFMAAAMLTIHIKLSAIRIAMPQSTH